MKKSIKNLSAVTTVGLHIAKNVFQVHGVDAAGLVVVARSVPLHVCHHYPCRRYPGFDHLRTLPRRRNLGYAGMAPARVERLS